MAKGKASAIDVAKRRARVFALLRVRATKEDILDKLGEEGFADVSSRTYDRDMAALKKDALKWVDTFAKQGLIDEYRIVVESLKERVRRLATIEADIKTNSRDKVAASVAIKEIELDIMELLIEGPTMWAVKRKGEQTDKAKPADITV